MSPAYTSRGSFPALPSPASSHATEGAAGVMSCQGYNEGRESAGWAPPGFRRGRQEESDPGPSFAPPYEMLTADRAARAPLSSRVTTVRARWALSRAAQAPGVRPSRKSARVWEQWVERSTASQERA